MRDMVQCEKCGEWYTYKYGCRCEKQENNKPKKEIKEKMEDLKLKHIINTLETNGVIRLNWKDTGESFCPRIGDFQRYSEYYVTGISARNNELVIRIQAEI